MINTDRSKVLVIGDQPLNKAPFIQRRLTPAEVRLEELDKADLTNNACGVLVLCHFLSPEEMSARLTTWFHRWFRRTCEMGLMTTIYGADINLVAALRDNAYERYKVGEGIEPPQKKSEWMAKLPWVFASNEEWAIADQLAHHNPGPPLGSPEITYLSSSIARNSSVELILKRAFHNARHVTITPLTGGRTATETFCVHATLNGRNGAGLGPQPMPFFIKFGSAWKIEDEKRHYADRAEPFIPFHLRPALIASRSVDTLECAALTCNFVDSATPLRAALRAGQANGAIFSLFEVTLRGLRAHATNSPKDDDVLETFVVKRARAHEIATNHPSRIIFLRRHRKKWNPSQLEEILVLHARAIKSHQGQCHGDLHYGNIMVRNRDAIVIDFGSMEDFGPLGADPAMLEVSLVFGTEITDARNSFTQWNSFVREIYEDPLEPPLDTGANPEFVWLRRAIRELRHVTACCAMTQPEMLITLAAAMIRYARYEPFNLPRRLMPLAEKKRAYALVVAHDLVEKLEQLKNASR
jgi:hypothetical protein